MKKLMALAIVMIFAGATSSWALLGLEDVSYDGSLEVTGISADNEVTQDDNTGDHRGEVNTRVRVGINATVTEGIKSRIEFSRTGGQYGRNLPGAASTANSIDDETAAILIENAYVDFEDLLGLDVRLGRQYYGPAGDLVAGIGPVDDDNLTNGAGLDGIKIGKDWEVVKAHVFMAKVRKPTAQATTQLAQAGAVGDTNANFIQGELPTLIPGGVINFGWLQGINTSTGAVSSVTNRLYIYRLGVKGGIQENMFTYRAEYLANSGENKQGNGTVTQPIKYKGTAIDLGIGVNLNDTPAGDWAFVLDYVVGSGDDNNTDRDDKSFRDFAALTGVTSSDRYYGEIFGKSNTLASAQQVGPGLDTGNQGQGKTVFHLGAKYVPAPMPKASVKLDYYMFNTTEDGALANSTADKYGNEIDLTLGYQQSENVGIEIGYAVLNPDDAITGVQVAGGPTINDDAITKAFARTKITWGGEE